MCQGANGDNSVGIFWYKLNFNCCGFFFFLQTLFIFRSQKGRCRVGAGKSESHSILPQRGNINHICTSNAGLSWTGCSHECILDMHIFSWYQSETLHLMKTISWCCYSAIVAALDVNVRLVCFVFFYKRFVIFPYIREMCSQLPGMSKCEGKSLLTAEWT